MWRKYLQLTPQDSSKLKRPQFKEKNEQEHEQTSQKKKTAVALKHKGLSVLTRSGVHIIRTILLLWTELQVIWKIGRISQEP